MAEYIKRGVNMANKKNRKKKPDCETIPVCINKECLGTIKKEVDKKDRARNYILKNWIHQRCAELQGDIHVYVIEDKGQVIGLVKTELGPEKMKNIFQEIEDAKSSLYLMNLEDEIRGHGGKTIEIMHANVHQIDLKPGK
jgi:hypothetical protein